MSDESEPSAPPDAEGRGAGQSDEQRGAARVVARLADELAEGIARRYRVDVSRARGLVLEAWARDKEEPLWRLVEREAVPEGDDEAAAARLRRTRVYKQAADRAKTKIYYHLRRYRQDDEGLADAVGQLHALAAEGVAFDDPRARTVRDAVVASHVSTRERLDELEAFWSALFALAPAPTNILDLGCGVMPLLYPFEGAGRCTARYLGLDRDAVAIELVSAWARLVSGERLRARRWALADGLAGVSGPEADGRFSLALALKLVPVVARQERQRLSVLADVPAPRLLVTGARQAMVKRRSIEQREQRSLRKFAEAHGLAVVDALETASEIGLLLEPR